MKNYRINDRGVCENPDIFRAKNSIGEIEVSFCFFKSRNKWGYSVSQHIFGKSYFGSLPYEEGAEYISKQKAILAAYDYIRLSDKIHPEAPKTKIMQILAEKMQGDLFDLLK